MSEDARSDASDAALFGRDRVFSIPGGRPFLRDLAQMISDAVAKEPSWSLSDVVVYLPTRRAARALHDAFTMRCEGPVTFLPIIKTLGDPEEDEIVAFSGTLDDEVMLPPAMAPLARQIELARLIIARERAFAGQEYWPSAFSAAGELATLLDELYTYQISSAAIHDAAPPELAVHWRQSLQFLKIVTEAWPAYLKEVGKIDMVDRRQRLIELQIAAWQRTPPQHPIVIAGTTGSTPIVVEMMKAIRAVPFGAIVLPGLDLQTDDRAWQDTDDTHPQSGLKALLGNLGIAREAVRAHGDQGTNSDALRRDTLSIALRPAEATDSWRDWAHTVKRQAGSLQSAFSGLELVEARDDDAEAGVIALKIREVLEEPDVTIALVTPDRNLGRRVASKLQRWGVQVDESAGIALGQTPCGVFLRHVANWLCQQNSYQAFFSMLRHEYFFGGLSAADVSVGVEELDRAARGAHLAPAGESVLDGLRLRLKDDASPLALALLDIFQSSAGVFPNHSAFETRIEIVINVAERLAGCDAQAGNERLWRGNDGEVGAAFLAELLRDAHQIDIFDRLGFAQAFERLLFVKPVRARGSQTRVSVLGPLEARLQYFDLAIIGGLNEGMWPRNSFQDSFLSPGMRERIGLPSPEKRIGLSAHDFAQSCAAPRVMLTRAIRSGGKPAKASRWIVRLKNILRGAQLLEKIDRSEYYLSLHNRLNAPRCVERIAAPSPCPPVNARPHTFYVTHVETLLRDPYSIYARHILGLRKLDPLDAPFERRHLGSLIHDVFERYVREGGDQGVTDPAAKLDALYQELGKKYGMDDVQKAFWREGAAEMFSWFAGWDKQRRTHGEPVVLEKTGAHSFHVDGVEFSIKAKADRIDRLHSGGAYLIDYKTGEAPSKKMSKKFSPQLALTGAIVDEGGFQSIGKVPPVGLEYVRVLNRKGEKKENVISEGVEARDAASDAFTGLVELLRFYQDPQTAYLSQPRPQYLNRFGDYDQLARRRERRLTGGDE